MHAAVPSGGVAALGAAGTRGTGQLLPWEASAGQCWALIWMKFPFGKDQGISMWRFYSQLSFV